FYINETILPPLDIPVLFMLYFMTVPNHGEFVTIGAFAFRRSKRLAIFVSLFIRIGLPQPDGHIKDFD
ncbi:MAG: hypothetical protein ABF645_09975, partial [Lentilactobacillus hilgardii]